MVVKWPGSTHDSQILNHSGLCRLFEDHRIPAGCYLLGDSGYPSKRWLLVPYSDRECRHDYQEAYNRAHKQTMYCGAWHWTTQAKVPCSPWRSSLEYIKDLPSDHCMWNSS